MSASESGMMTSREQFGLQNMHVAFNSEGSSVYPPVGATSPVYQSSIPVAGNGGVSATGVMEIGAAGGGAIAAGLNINIGSESMKRKRGRPRKYGPDATMALGLTPTPPPQSSGGFSPLMNTVSPAGRSASPASFKKRGRPVGSSSKKQRMEALGSQGIGFTPHVINVMAGEDVSSKIMSFSQQGTRAVCVLSANGAISNVTLRQASTSGGSVTYEGRFEILSLSGSFLLSENGGARSRTGGLSVSLSGPDGRVLGGSVAGLLTAASPVQVIVGSFITDSPKQSKSTHQMEPLFAPPKHASGGPTGANSSPSRGTLSESSGGPGSPLNQSAEACYNSNPQGMSSMPWK